MSAEEIRIGEDGYYHPSSEDQIIALVKKARKEGLQIRCRGASHSNAHAIYTDPGEGDPPIPNKVSEQEPPKGPNINIMLDQYYGLEWLDEEKGIAEVEAGIHLGEDPEDRTHTSTYANSLLCQAFKKGWTFSDLGGITHQTISGFLSTGSAGGSLTYDLGENLLAFRVIDGTGSVRWFEKGKDEEFAAMSPSMGLLGIISKVRLQLVPNYNVCGQEITTPTSPDKCPIDLFGSGREPDGNPDDCPPERRKPSMEEFLRETPYTRMLWWPQKGVKRIATWQAVRGKSLPVIDPIPYLEFSDIPFFTKLMQLGGGILFTLLGNKGIFKVWKKIHNCYRRFRNRIKRLWQKKIGKFLGWLFSGLITLFIEIIMFIPTFLLSIFRFLTVWLLPVVIRIMQPLTKKGKAEVFMDFNWRSLPMDLAADDILLGTEFTEIWIPLKHTPRVMQLMEEHFTNGGLKATGTYSTELYAGYKSESWMSPGYGEDTFRVDLFWYIGNDGSPAGKDGFYSQFWELFRENNIPFRLHWGKFLPEYDYKEWAEYFRQQHPRWDDFMKFREKQDPDNIFLTTYWRRHLLGEETA